MTGAGLSTRCEERSAASAEHCRALCRATHCNRPPHPASVANHPTFSPFPSAVRAFRTFAAQARAWCATRISRLPRVALTRPRRSILCWKHMGWRIRRTCSTWRSFGPTHGPSTSWLAPCSRAATARQRRTPSSASSPKRVSCFVSTRRSVFSALSGPYHSCLTLGPCPEHRHARPRGRRAGRGRGRSTRLLPHSAVHRVQERARCLPPRNITPRHLTPRPSGGLSRSRQTWGKCAVS